MLAIDRRHRFAFAILVTVALAPPAAADSVLRVGTSGDYAPFSVHDAAGGFTGFDVIVAQRLAADLGRAVEFVPFRWPELVDRLRAGAFDIAMAGVTVRADRAVQLAFTRPYAVTGAVAVIRANDRRTYRRVADLDRRGVRMVVNQGGHLEQVARRRFTHARLTTVTDNALLPDVLRRGEADAAISEALEARTWPAEEFVTLGPFTHDRKAYALPRSATDLVRQVNDWLAAREADGWLNEQRKRWLGEPAAMSPEQACFEAVVGAIDLRLQLMPLVAAVKRRDHLPIHDPAQEARVLERVRAAAAATDLNQDDVAALFNAQMDAAKAAEEHAANTTVPADMALAALRSAIATVSDQLITEVARCQPWLHDPRLREQLDARVHAGLAASGAPPATLARLAEALRHVRRGSQ